MSDALDPSTASIDGMIHWLSKARLDAPHAKLSELLVDRVIEPPRLVDLACIDLMHRRRLGHAIGVEQYVEQFPSIGSPPHVLDLIDAELCVAAELGQRCDREDLIARFPTLTAEIDELMQLDVATATLVRPSAREFDRVIAADPRSDSRDGEFSVDVAPLRLEGHRGQSLTEYPVQMPQWFVAEKCIASGPGHWLIRGRDSTRGMMLALKVIELPGQLASEQSTQILDSCEMASKVRNPHWVPPNVAAVQHSHLGVIRPWLFATPWHTVTAQQSLRDQLRRLATVAFALQAAHKIGAAHGGIHSDNLLVDHDGNVQLVDGAASRQGIGRWFGRAGESSDPHTGCQPQDRRRLDTEDLIKLVAETIGRSDRGLGSDLGEQLRQVAGDHPDDACGVIGERLIGRADTIAVDQADPSPPPSPSWRRRLADWWTR